MKLFLCGGGCGDQTIDAMKQFKKLLNVEKPLLYIPLAMEKEKYAGCLEWITKELRTINITNIDMVNSNDELEQKDLNKYCAIFIGGGNTYKLLNDLKNNKSYEMIKDFINNDGIVFGGSAGAIIFGENIDTCKISDNKEIIDIDDTRGYNVLNGISLLCHYKEGTDKTNKNLEYLIKYSENKKIIYLPEEDTIFINNDKITIIGESNYCLIENSNLKILDPNKEKF